MKKKYIIAALVTALCVLMSGCSGAVNFLLGNPVSSQGSDMTEAVTEQSKMSPYDEYIANTLIPQYGVFNVTELSLTPLHSVPFLNEGSWCTSTGIMSARQEDLDGDGTAELIVPYLKKQYYTFNNSNSEYNGEYSALYLMVCTLKDNTVTKIADVRMDAVIDCQDEWVNMLISEKNGKKYLCFEESRCYGEFGCERKFFFINYDGDSLNTDIVYSPYGEGFFIRKISNMDLLDFDYDMKYINEGNSLFDEYPSAGTEEEFDRVENNYDKCYSDELAKYGLAFGEKGEVLFKYTKSLDTSNTDNIFTIYAHLNIADNKEKVSIKEFTGFAKAAEAATMAPEQSKAQSSKAESMQPETQVQTENYKEDFIDALMSNQSIWYTNKPESLVYRSAITFTDLNFDGKPELIMQLGGVKLGENDALIYYYKDGKVAKANMKSDWENGMQNNLTAYYDKGSGKYRLFEAAYSNVGTSHSTLTNIEMFFDGTGGTEEVFSSKASIGSNGKVTDKYYSVNFQTEISEDEYNKINSERIKDCVNVNMDTKLIYTKDWETYSESEKRQALIDSYDSLSYDKY